MSLYMCFFLFLLWSQVLVVDAKNFGEEPIAKIKLPQRVPYGFHGSFFTSR
ncbi:putative 9-cis-epoxycarotenoid dioxygenase [Helianthus annuus]|nr:putative 9-cis-epoxycarotenoid dioxygenase [Helianthus annuus]